MVEYIPAVLPKDFDDLEVHLAQVKGKVPWVQIDVCDGIFVPSKTWPYSDSSHWKEILGEQEGFPYWEDFQFEIDLMAERPLTVLDEWIRAGASRIIVHIESQDAIADVRAALEGRAELTVAVSLDTDILRVEQILQEGDAVQVMGIARIGFQGQPFDDRALERLKHFRTQFPDVILSVDGGVNLESAPRLVEAGARRLVIGSALFNTNDIRETLGAFKQQINDLHISGENS